MTTKKAFKKLLEDTELLKKTKASQSTVRKWRERYNKNLITLDKMEAILKKAGGKKTPEVWTFK